MNTTSPISAPAPVRSSLSRLASLAVCALLMAAAPLASMADTWRWKDENGKWVYSERRPPGQEAERVKLFGTKSTAPDKMRQLRDKSDTSDAVREQRKQGEAVARATNENERIAKANCETARKNLELLESSQRIQTTDADGKRADLSEEDREAQKASNRQAVEDYCR